MRVLLTHRPGGAYAFISDGWANALRAVGHTVQRWDDQHSSWHAFQPDLYIGCSGHRQSIPAPSDRGKTQVAIHVNPHGPHVIPGIMEAPEVITWVRDRQPDAVFGYGHESDRPFWLYWTTQLGFPWVPMPTAGDTMVYKMPKEMGREENRTVHVGFVGGRWGYKAQNADKWVLPVFQSNEVASEIAGWGGWDKVPLGPHARWLGGISDDDAVALYQRSRVVPCLCEPHTIQWGIDLPERCWKAILCGAVAVHDPAKEIHRFLSRVPAPTTPAEFLDLCIYWSRDQREPDRQQLVRVLREQVFAEHTYFHRMGTLLEALGHTAEAGQLRSYVRKQAAESL
jgi:hypothetical protein